MIAERTGCAIVLIAHMGKKRQSALHRSLGTVDFPATARNILLVGHTSENRVIAQVKNSLAPIGKSMTFSLDSGFRIIGEFEISADDLCLSADNEYLSDIDRQAEESFSRLVKEMAEREGITEQLKAENQMLGSVR